MLDPKDYHLVSALADAVQDPVGAAASGPDSGEVVAEWLADSVRIVERASVARPCGCSVDCPLGWSRRHDLGRRGVRSDRERAQAH